MARGPDGKWRRRAGRQAVTAVIARRATARDDQTATIAAMNGEVIRRRVTVHGQVQGVFFRDSTRERADAHGVNGWARNMPDGSVEAVLEGDPEAVERVVRFLQTGRSH